MRRVSNLVHDVKVHDIAPSPKDASLLITVHNDGDSHIVMHPMWW